jgi:hypothetical protein
MRSIKTLGLTIIAAIAVAGFTMATPAMGQFDTALCTAHTGLTCSEGHGVNSLHLALSSEGPYGGIYRLLNSTANVLCLNLLAEAEVGSLGEAPQGQELTFTSLNLSGCGTGSSHTNCTITAEELPVYDLLKTGLDKGILTALNGTTRFKCTIFGFIKIDCLYDATGLEFVFEGGEGGGTIVAEELPATLKSGGGLCPEESFLDYLLEALEPLHVVSSEGTPPPSTVLCKTHTASSCAEKDLAKSLHMVTAKPPLLLNTVANIECEQSLTNATALSLGSEKAQKLDVTELTWKECHTQGAADNCTLSSKSLPTIDLTRTALNLGTAASSGLKVGIECAILDLFELDCVYGGTVELQAEGALYKEGTGHGRFTADKEVLEKLEGEGHCPDTIKWDASYEPLEHVYIVE